MCMACEEMQLFYAYLDAVEEAKEHADWVSTLPGGRGAVREFLELILKAQGRWDAIVRELSDSGAH